MSLLKAVQLASPNNASSVDLKKKPDTGTVSLIQAVRSVRGEETTFKAPVTEVTQTEDKSIFQKVFNFMGGVASSIGGLFKPKIISPIPLEDGSNINLVDANTKDTSVKEDNGLISPFKSGSTALDLAPSTMRLLADLQVDPLSLKKAPKATLVELFKPFWLTRNPVTDQMANAYITGIKDAVLADADSIKRIFTSKTGSERTGAVLETGARTVGVALSPISALFSAANDVPVLGTISKLISLPFAILGDAGADIAYPIVNVLPISKKAKEDIVGGIGEIAGLALMIGVGGKVADLPGKVKETLIKRYGKVDAETIITKAETIANTPQEKPLSGIKKPQDIVDYVFNNKLNDTPDGKSLLKAATEAQKSNKYLQLEEPKVAGLLQEKNATPKGEISGEGFVMTEKADKSKVQVGKVLNSYRDAVDSYNKNPTTESLARFVKAREAVNNLEKQELVKIKTPEVTKPTTVNGVEIKPIGEEVSVFRGTSKGEVGMNAEKPNGITGGESTSTDRAIAQAFADRKGGVVEEYKIPKTANIVNHSELERLVKYVPTEEKTATVKKFIKDNGVDVVKFDIPEGAKGEAEYRIVNPNIFKELSTGSGKIVEKEVKVPRDQMPIGKGPEQVSRLEARMKGVLGKATKDQIDELGLSTFQKMNRKETISDSAKYVLEHPDEALEVLQGKREAPKGQYPESIYVAMTEVARDDITLATKLASLQATTIGQRLSLLAEIDPLNPVKIVSDIYKFREKSVEKTYAGKKVSEIIKRDVEKGKAKIKAPKLTDWNSFIESVRC